MRAIMLWPKPVLPQSAVVWASRSVAEMLFELAWWWFQMTPLALG